jgi:hypothetical protein
VPPNRSPKASLTIDRPIATLIRKACRRERIDLSTFLLTLLREYARRHHPEWEIVEPERSPAGIVAIGGTEDFLDRPDHKGPTFGLARRITRAEVQSFEGYVPNPPRAPRDAKPGRKRRVAVPAPEEPKAHLTGGPRIRRIVLPAPGEPQGHLTGGPRIVRIIVPAPKRRRS